ncbi:hypothetical protein H0H81_007500 [Sphagnurus paluster]|uniref:N-alpha-acetyltransferase 40 n=1 Tax=Sphagnurus paluster TaxID=117069 RepID=A0A9P7KIP4_9AGAR|nr:hypothetical protein H0H81_007500 [Sphagnurus paluster]
MSVSSLVRKANKNIEASSAQLLNIVAALDFTTTFVDYLGQLRELGSKKEKDAIWMLFKENMQKLKSSFGWDPKSKMEELFNPMSRFLLIESDDQLIAFSMFRFESEEGEDVLYCYDLQIQRLQQRNGLGSFLIQALVAIATAWRMEKVVLTVFKANHSAIKFYEASGYDVRM